MFILEWACLIVILFLCILNLFGLMFCAWAIYDLVKMKMFTRIVGISIIGATAGLFTLINCVFWQATIQILTKL